MSEDGSTVQVRASLQLPLPLSVNLPCLFGLQTLFTTVTEHRDPAFCWMPSCRWQPQRAPSLPVETITPRLQMTQKYDEFILVLL